MVTSTQTTTSASFTATSSSTTLQTTLLLPVSLEGTVQGQVVQESLQVVLDSLNSSEVQEIYTSTPSGEVAIVKLPPTTSTVTASPYTELSVSKPAGVVTVLIPTDVVDSIEGNRMLIVTEVSETVKAELPVGNEAIGAGRGELNSAVFEMSLASEVAGSVAVANVSGLLEPILFRIRSGEDPIDGDVCVFYDTAAEAWSTDGLEIVAASALGDGFANGTWCRTTHLSLFAVMQVIPFDQMLPSESSIPSSSGIIAIVSMIFCCGGCCVVCFLLKRRLRTPTTGQAIIQDGPKGSLKFDFTRSGVVSDTTSVKVKRKWSRNSQKKVLVKWHLNPDNVVKHIDTLQGLRDVSLNLEKVIQPVVHVESIGAVSSKSSFHNLTDSMVGDEEDPKDFDLSQDPNTSKILELMAPIAPANMDREAYADGELVLYNSETYGRVMPANIVGKGLFYSEGSSELEAWPLYSCKVGAKLRELIPLRLLQAPLEEGMLVHVELPDQRGTWGSGRVLEVPLWQRTHLTSYPSYQVILGDSKTVSVSFEKIKRVFFQDQLVEAYMGRIFGWVYGTLAEEVVEEPGAEVKLVLVRDELAVTIPSFLVRSRPALTARI